MSGLQGPLMNSPTETEAFPSFRERTSPLCRCWKLPRRYLLAIMCSLAFFYRGWTLANITMIFFHLLVLDEDERMLHMPTIANFTDYEQGNILKTEYLAYVIGQIPAAMLIIKFSPYRIIQISMILSSFLQLITPWTLKISAIAFIFNIFLQGLCGCPMDCAFIGLWREWAPATEKTRLLMISFSGRYVYSHIVFPLCMHLSEAVSPVANNYFAGMAGIVWCILWIFLISDSPTNDRLISDAELQYLEEQVPSRNKEKITLSSVPVKSILTSPPVLSLCLVFMSSALSARSAIYLIIVQVHILEAHHSVDWMFWCMVINCIVMVPAAGVLIDFLINKNIIETTTIRKVVCCCGLVLHAIFLTLLAVPDMVVASVCFFVSIMIFPFTSAGVLPNLLDLSPRYACAIMGLAMAIHSLTSFLYDLLLEYLISEWTRGEWVINFIPVEILAIVAAIVFAIFGSGKEQVWSGSSPSTERENNDSQYYPGTDFDDEMLITGGL